MFLVSLFLSLLTAMYLTVYIMPPLELLFPFSSFLNTLKKYRNNFQDLTKLSRVKKTAVYILYKSTHKILEFNGIKPIIVYIVFYSMFKGVEYINEVRFIKIVNFYFE